MATKKTPTVKTKTVKTVEKTTAPKVSRARKSDARVDDVQTMQSVEHPTLPHDAIAIRAYERFVARGYQHGFDVEDWLAAERELMRSYSA